MIHEDTIKLMKECDSGIKMGLQGIEDALPYVQSEKLKRYLIDCRKEHEALRDELDLILNSYHDGGKEPSFMLKSMSYIKTNVKLSMNATDEKVADLITDGCNMGIKSLNKYLNEYKAAEEKVKDITKKLIKLEEKLNDEIKSYL